MAYEIVKVKQMYKSDSFYTRSKIGQTIQTSRTIEKLVI